MKLFKHYKLPASFHHLTKRIIFLPIDIFDYISGRRPEYIPPKGKIYISYTDYIKEGEKYLTYFQELAGLQPHHSVFEIGSGIGRMAVPLTHFLNQKGSYDGIDTVKSNIHWCNKNISAKYSNFNFLHTCSDKKQYNNSNQGNSSNFKIAYDDSKFDFIFLTSIFTHVMPAELEHYLNEISRVMKPGATILMAFYIVNCVSEDLMIKKPAKMHFPYNKGFYRLSSLHAEDKYVAYDEEWLLEKLGNAGLKMKSIQFGQWCGREHYFDYQDLLICSKV